MRIKAAIFTLCLLATFLILLFRFLPAKSDNNAAFRNRLTTNLKFSDREAEKLALGNNDDLIVLLNSFKGQTSNEIFTSKLITVLLYVSLTPLNSNDNSKARDSIKQILHQADLNEVTQESLLSVLRKKGNRKDIEGISFLLTSSNQKIVQACKETINALSTK